VLSNLQTHKSTLNYNAVVLSHLLQGAMHGAPGSNPGEEKMGLMHHFPDADLELTNLGPEEERALEIVKGLKINFWDKSTDNPSNGLWTQEEFKQLVSDGV
jgi:hypothetical protein